MAAATTLGLVLGWHSWSTVRGLGASLTDLATRNSHKTEMLGDIQAAGADMRAAVRQTVLSSALRDTADYEKARQTFLNGANHIDELVAKVRPYLVTARGKEDLAAVVKALADWRTAYTQIVSLCGQGHPQQANEVRKGPQRTAADELTKAVAEMVDIQKGLVARAVVENESAVTRSSWISLVLVFLSLGVGVAVLVIVRRACLRMQHLAAEVSEAAHQVAGGASQLSASSQALAQGASEQSASVEQSSAASEQITAMCKQGAHNAQSAADFTSAATTQISAANSKLDHMTASMEQIGASSGKISKIIKVIDEIAFQTNILALNAAVEAARAGESGLGFAVVADEVRNLAQRSAQAARDTAALIEESIHTSEEARSSVQDVVSAIGSVTESAGKVKTLVDEITRATQEQARGISEIATGIAQIQQVTQTTAAGAEECAATGEEMSAQAESMRQISTRLSDLVGARGAW